MNKPFIITFSVCIIIFATAAIVMLMLLLPKQLVSLQTSVETYQGIEKSNYTYVKTKDISKEALLKEYKVTNDNIDEFRRTYKYIAGNSDPFYRPTQNAENTADNKNNTNANTNTNNNSNTSNGGTTSGSQTAQDKTTNSNGGIKNPESTTK